jgi:hypothetical protein
MRRGFVMMPSERILPATEKMLETIQEIRQFCCGRRNAWHVTSLAR